jgi:hypothetical protein
MPAIAASGRGGRAARTGGALTESPGSGRHSDHGLAIVSAEAIAARGATSDLPIESRCSRGCARPADGNSPAGWGRAFVDERARRLMMEAGAELQAVGPVPRRGWPSGRARDRDLAAGPPFEGALHPVVARRNGMPMAGGLDPAEEDTVELRGERERLRPAQLRLLGDTAGEDRRRAHVEGGPRRAPGSSRVDRRPVGVPEPQLGEPVRSSRAFTSASPCPPRGCLRWS